MRLEWPEAAISVHDTTVRALHAAGGVDLARRAEDEPKRRIVDVAPLLDRLGLRELDPWGDEDESAAALLAVRAAGAVVLPWPLAHELAVPIGDRGDYDGVHLVQGTVGRLDHADVLARSIAVDTDRATARRVVAGEGAPAPLDPFGVPVTLAEEMAVDRIRDVVAMRTLLDAAWIAGALETVVALAARHAGEREQFGVAIGRFGEVRWHLSDMVVARDGLAELVRYTWWLHRVGRARDADVLALRLHAIEAATETLSHGHQVLAATGLCDEHDLSVVDRHLQPLLRRPGGVHATVRRLADAVARDGFSGIFPVEAWRGREGDR
jgi:hypothetical protein